MITCLTTFKRLNVWTSKYRFDDERKGSTVRVLTFVGVCVVRSILLLRKYLHFTLTFKCLTVKYRTVGVARTQKPNLLIVVITRLCFIQSKHLQNQKVSSGKKKGLLLCVGYVLSILTVDLKLYILTPYE